MVEEVVKLRTEFKLHALDREVEFFVQSKIGLVEGWGPAGVAGQVAEGADQVSGCVFGRRQNERSIVDVLDVSGAGKQ